MIRGLKIALIAYGVIGILLGLVFVVVPYQVASMFGLGEIAAYVPYFMAMCGVSFMAPAVWLIVARARPATAHYLGEVCHIVGYPLWSSRGILNRPWWR